MSAGSALYTQALSRGGALLPEMRTLLRAWIPGEQFQDFARRITVENTLGRATQRTATDYLSAFSRRFVSPETRPVETLHHLAKGGAGTQQMFRDVVFFHTANVERLLWDFVTGAYWPASRMGSGSVNADTVRKVIVSAETDGRIRRPWSAEVHRDLPARVLNAACQFGLLGPGAEGRRPIIALRPADETIAWFAIDAHVRGVPDGRIAGMDVWKLFGLTPEMVLDRLAGLHGDRWLDVQRSGEVVRISWLVDSMEEVIVRVAHE